MSKEKKKIRKRFRESVFRRDLFTCQVCGKKYSESDSDPSLKRMNAHHITDRSLMPNGGYVKENGITVCEEPCHMRVEAFHIFGKAEPGLAPSDLYEKIGSSYEKALAASQNLN